MGRSTRIIWGLFDRACGLAEPWPAQTSILTPSSAPTLTHTAPTQTHTLWPEQHTAGTAQDSTLTSQDSVTATAQSSSVSQPPDRSNLNHSRDHLADCVVLVWSFSGASMWFFIFYRARQDGAVLLVSSARL